MAAHLTPETLTAALNWRYAAKHFDTARPIADADWKALEEALRLSASSYGLQPWKFIVVKDPALRQKLAPAAYNQPQVTEASRLVVIARRKGVDAAYVDHYLADIAATRGLPVEALKGFRDMLMNTAVALPPDRAENWLARQPYIALGTFLTAAALMGIDACPMEGFDAAAFDKILGLEGGEYASVAMVAAGYRSPADDTQHYKKARFSRDEVIQTL